MRLSVHTVLVDRLNRPVGDLCDVIHYENVKGFVIMLGG